MASFCLNYLEINELLKNTYRVTPQKQSVNTFAISKAIILGFLRIAEAYDVIRIQNTVS